MPTIAELLKNAPTDREYFIRALLGIDLAELYLHPTRVVDTAVVTRLRALERKRASGWPVQYLLGEAWFFGRRFAVTRFVLIPRPETELLVERAIEILKNQPGAVLDIGTGSGAIAISIALASPGARVTALDFSAKALVVARANAHMLKADIKFEQSNLLTHITWPRTSFVLIAANLPYLSDSRMETLSLEVKHEPRAALYGGPDGLDLYEKLFMQIKKHRHPKQRVVILAEIDPEQQTKLATLRGREFPHSQIEFHRDLHGDIRLGEIIC